MLRAFVIAVYSNAKNTCRDSKQHHRPSFVNWNVECNKARQRLSRKTEGRIIKFVLPLFYITNGSQSIHPLLRWLSELKVPEESLKHVWLDTFKADERFLIRWQSLLCFSFRSFYFIRIMSFKIFAMRILILVRGGISNTALESHVAVRTNVCSILPKGCNLTWDRWGGEQRRFSGAQTT